jgi:hypothetical protein
MSYDLPFVPRPPEMPPGIWEIALLLLASGFTAVVALLSGGPDGRQASDRPGLLLWVAWRRVRTAAWGMVAPSVFSHSR